MKHSNITQIFSTLVLGSTLAITGCSSGGDAPSVPSYDGVNTPAAFTADNALSLSTTSTEASEQVISDYLYESNSPFGAPGATTDAPSSTTGASISTTEGFAEKINGITKTVTDSAQSLNLPVGFAFTSDQLNDIPELAIYFTFCGGSISGPDSGQGTFTYNNLCIEGSAPSDQIVLNGPVRMTSTDTSFTTTYINFSMTFGGETFVLNSTITCSETNEGFSCATLFVDADGKTHKIENDVVFTNITDGSYGVDATVYHHDYGSVTMNATGLTFNCTNGRPGTGSINMTGTGGTSASITFDNCTSYTYCYDLGGGPVCDIGTW